MKVLSAAALAVTVVTIPGPAEAAPLFQMPFSCGYVTNATTYRDHQSYAVDWNRSDDLGRWVYAGASGTARRYNSGSAGYGLHVIVTHGTTGWTSLYAHLRSTTVPVSGTLSVGRLTKIGEVGSTGNSTGPHLHHEQRYNGVRKQIYVNGVAVRYGTAYKSANC